MFNHGRAAMLVSGDIEEFCQRAATMPAHEMYAMGDELAAMISHPVTHGLTQWRDKAGQRLGVLVIEAGRRWLAQWEHEDNRALSDRMELISELYA